MIQNWQSFNESKQTEYQALKILGYSDKADNKDRDRAVEENNKRGSLLSSSS